jgi:hypothetical protein
MDLPSGSFADSTQKGAGAAFAVGPPNMNDRRQLKMRVAKLVQEAKHAVKAQINQLRVEAMKPLEGPVGSTEMLVSHGGGRTLKIRRQV